MNMPKGSSDGPTLNAHLYEEALALMERALVVLDQARLYDAAAHLDHAICLVPRGNGIAPRARVAALERVQTDLTA
jgi:hypothetical protein